MQNILFSGFISQLCLALLAQAAPIETATAGHGNAWQYGTGGGILGLVVLILDVIVLSTSAIELPSVRAVSSMDAAALLMPGDALLTATARSRGPQVQPPARIEADLGPRRLHLPHRRPAHLLPLLGPCRPQQRLRVRTRRLDGLRGHRSRQTHTAVATVGVRWGKCERGKRRPGRLGRSRRAVWIRTGLPGCQIGTSGHGK